MNNGRPNIVLVHGAWADGSSWSSVIERLQTNGFQVRAPQFPLSSLADDLARLRQVLEFLDGPTLVVGHSYGGQIITALGDDAPNVADSCTSRPSASTRVSRSSRFSRRGR
jgi:pimeloyl-ACP methyl ester carboxylesterase